MKLPNWVSVLLIASGLYLLGVAALYLTENSNLFPTVVLLGSFMVPVAYVSFFYEKRLFSRIDVSTVALAFLYGGVLGVSAASLLEPLFIKRLDFATAFVVGLIEEAAKIIGVLLIARNIKKKTEIDGIIVGAAAGMGFAALESMGYAFSEFMRSNGNVTLTLGITLLRGLLSPIGHGTWTAILTGVLFRESKDGRLNFNAKVVSTYLAVAALHGAWDGIPTVISEFVLPGADFFFGELIVASVGFYLLYQLWKEGANKLTTFIPPGAP